MAYESGRDSWLQYLEVVVIAGLILILSSCAAQQQHQPQSREDIQSREETDCHTLETVADEIVNWRNQGVTEDAVRDRVKLDLSEFMAKPEGQGVLKAEMLSIGSGLVYAVVNYAYNVNPSAPAEDVKFVAYTECMKGLDAAVTHYGNSNSVR